MSEGKKLREWAINCRRLAVGAGDPQFTLKLNALANEYEAKASKRMQRRPRTKNKAEQLRRPCRAVWRKEKRIGVAFD